MAESFEMELRGKWWWLTTSAIEGSDLLDIAVDLLIINRYMAITAFDSGPFRAPASCYKESGF